MDLVKLTDRISYLPHHAELDRPMLAYVKGDRFALAIDAGYSKDHIDLFHSALTQAGLALPDFTVITHWHYDHTFGLHAAKGISIAHRKTNAALRELRRIAENEALFAMLKEKDPCYAKEYADAPDPEISPADIEYDEEAIINLGGVTAKLIHPVSPHSEDSTCVYIPEERILFLGDCTSEDFLNDGYMDLDKLHALVSTIRSVECETCVLSHCEPLSKNELVAYLEQLG